MSIRLKLQWQKQNPLRYNIRLQNYIFFYLITCTTKVANAKLLQRSSCNRSETDQVWALGRLFVLASIWWMVNSLGPAAPTNKRESIIRYTYSTHKYMHTNIKHYCYRLVTCYHTWIVSVTKLTNLNWGLNFKVNDHDHQTTFISFQATSSG